MEKNQFAVIETGGKQYRVEPNQVIGVERVRVKDPGQEFVFGKVLLTQKGNDIAIGNPYVAGATVTCEVVKELKGPKVISYKYTRRKNYRKKIGHRQIITELKVKDIQHGA